MRQEGLSVLCQPGAAGHPPEQHGAQARFERGDPLRHRLLAEAEPVGRALELALLGDGDEGQHRVGVHAAHCSVHNRWLYGKHHGLFDPAGNGSL